MQVDRPHDARPCAAAAAVADDVAAEEDDADREGRGRRSSDAAAAVLAGAAASASSRGSAPPRARGVSSAGGPAASRSSCARRSRSRSAPVGSLPTSSSKSGLVAHCSSPSRSRRQPRQRAPRPRLHRTEREVEVVRPPRSATCRSSTRARSPRAPAAGSSSSARCTRHATSAVLRPLCRPRLARRRSSGSLGVGAEPAAAEPVDDRVPRHGVQPCRPPRRVRAGSVEAERQIAANASCTASSAWPRSPSRRSARPKTGRT